MTNADAIARELGEKDKVIAQLTQTLALTRDCLETARKALESIAEAHGASDASGDHARCRELALDALAKI